MPNQTTKQTLFIALAIVSLVVVEAFVIVGGRLAEEALNQRKHTHETLIAISEVNERKDHTESLVREFVVTGSETLGPRAEKNASEIHTRLARARQFMGDDTNQVRRLDRLDTTLKDLTARWATTLATRRTQGKDAAEKLVSEGIGRRLTDEAEFLLDEMEAEENRLLTERSARAATYSSLCSHSAKVGGVLTVLFGFLALRALREQVRARDAANVHVEHLLRRQEHVFKSIGDGLHGLDLDGTVNFENAAAERMLGWAPGELVGKPAHAAMHHHRADGTDYPVANCPIYATLADGQTRTVRDEVFWRKDGTSFPVEYVVSGVTDEKGKRFGAIVTFRDVTEHRAQEEALRASEAYNRSIVESSPDCLKLLSLDARLTYMAPAGCRVMEVDDFCMIENAEWLTFWKGEDNAAARRAVEAARAGGIGNFQGFCPTVKGSPRWWDVSISAILGSTGKPEKLLCISRDISGRKNLEQDLQRAHDGLEQRVTERTAELRLERAKLAAAFDNMELGLIMSDAKGDDITMNAAAERMHGFASRADLHAKLKDYTNDWELRDNTGRLLPFVEWPLPRALRGDYCREWDLHLHNLRSGHEWDGSYTCVPVRNDSGAVSRIIITVMDITGRKRMESTLRESETRLRKVMDGLGPYMFVGLMTPAGVLIEANAPALAAAGLKPEDVLGKPFEQTYWWAYSETVQQQLRAAIERAAGGTPSRYDVQLRAAEGVLFWIDFSLHPLRDETGKIVFLVPSAIVITERKQAEESLREHKDRLAAIIEHQPECVKVVDAQGRLLSMNAAGLAMLEVGSLAELQQKSLGDFIVLEYRPAFRELHQRVMAGGQGALEFEVVGQHGTRRWLETHAAPLRDGAGQVSSLLGITRDITDSKRAQEEIRALNASLEQRVHERTLELARTTSAVEAMQDAVFMFAADTLRFFFVNDGAQRQVGYSHEELLAMTPLSIKPAFTEAQFRDMVAPLLESREQVLKFTTVHRHKDGRDIPVEINLQMAGEGDQRCFVALCRDVTERQLAEDTLRKALAELSRANAELDDASRHKDEFLANMSHELRTPLNAILGLSEALLEQVSGTLTPRQVKSVTTISTSGQHLLALINDILDLSKIEAGKLELHPEPLNVDEFCQSCLVFVRTQAMQKQIAVAFEQDGRAAQLSADPKRLKQILVNLLTNAVKFTPQGGRIGLSVAAPEGEGAMRFTVWDSGIGIAPADQAKLFRAFTQVDSGLNRAQEGTGLGLALVAKLVELHGGSVSLESEPGKGSRFIVTLPLSHAPVAIPEGRTGDTQFMRLRTEQGTLPATQPQIGAPTFRRALVIEDDPTAGEQLVHYLTLLGVKSALHVRGAESIQAALREKPDVILLDILLPDESGWVVLAKLKEHPQTRDIPVAVVSVVDEPEKSLAMGAVAHFTKPFTREQLAAFLNRPFTPKPEPVPRPAPAAPSTGPCILLAEDNEANIQTIGGYLGDKGYAMHYALNGLVAVKLARELRPALILMDIQMPVMDGLTAIKELRADAAFARTPIIALTALAMSGDRERCIAAGATEYMSKPVKLKELTELVEKLLKRDA